jgi:hypothetical protein
VPVAEIEAREVVREAAIRTPCSASATSLVCDPGRPPGKLGARVRERQQSNWNSQKAQEGCRVRIT